MILKALVVDDEKRVRTGLVSNIQWKRYGFSEPMEASNGEAALSIMQQNKIDVVITDIRMPVMSGIELAEKIHSRYPSTKVIILSGYNDFEYAQTAMRYGVTYYLTKPTDINELQQILEKIHTEFEENLSKEEQINRINEKYSRISKLLSTRYMDELYYKDIRNDSQYSDLFENPSHIYTPAILHLLSDNTNNSVLDSDMLETLIRSLLLDHGIHCVIQKHDRLFLMILNHNYPDDKEIATQVNNALTTTGTITGIKWCLLYGNNFTDIPMMAQCCHLLTDRISICNWRNNQGMFQCSETEMRDLSPDDIAVYTGQYLDHAMNDTHYELINYLKNLFMNELAYIPLTQLRSLTESMITSVRSYYEKKLIVGTAAIAEVAGTDVMQRTELVDRLAEIIIRLREASQDQTYSVANAAVVQVKNLLENEYMKQISLEYISKSVNMSPSYISRMFKSIIGINLTEYLTQLRIDKAKQLLCDYNIRIYEVGNKVGYNNIRHFSHVFRDIVGLTPTEYRERLLAIQRKDK